MAGSPHRAEQAGCWDNDGTNRASARAANTTHARTGWLDAPWFRVVAGWLRLRAAGF